MKIISKIKIHPFFYFFAILCILTGYFKPFIVITFIIIVHELGHILVSQIFHYKIDKIVLLPFGGVTIFKELINRPMKEEFFIAVAGPLFQTSLFFILKGEFFYYNLFILLFNLLPIFPLDGSKMINIILNFFFSFQKSHCLSIIVSFLVILCFLFKMNFILLCIVFFLFLKTIKELKEHDFIVNKFLFERYLYSIHFRKLKKIKGEDVRKMKRDHQHLFYFAHSYHTEYEMLKRMFDKRSFL